MIPSPRRVIIAGAGISGPLLAVGLAHSGRNVVLLDHRPDPRGGEAPEGRSINLVLPQDRLDRLIHICGTPDLQREVVVLHRRVIHQADGGEVVEPYRRQDDPRAEALRPRGPICAISRHRLHRALVSVAAARPGVEFRFGWRVTGVDCLTGEVTATPPDGGPAQLSATMVIGADGAGSLVRAALAAQGLTSVTLGDSGLSYREVSLAPGLPTDAFHLWPRPGLLLSALPNPDGSFTGALFVQCESAAGDALSSDPSQARAVIERMLPDAVDHLTQLDHDLAARGPARLGSARVTPWYAGRVVLVGDACHAMPPFTGQGVGQALDDCEVLVDELNGGAVPQALAAYAMRRRATADAAQALAEAIGSLVVAGLPAQGTAGAMPPVIPA